MELRVASASDGPLTGTLEITATPIAPLADGLGAPQILAPGAVAAFSFTVEKAGLVGAGVRSDPDRATMRLLDSAGKVLGEGVAQMLRLESGRYAMEVSAPADGGVLTVRPALAGLSPPPSGPPPDVAADYLELTGQTPASAR